MKELFVFFVGIMLAAFWLFLIAVIVAKLDEITSLLK